MMSKKITNYVMTMPFVFVVHSLQLVILIALKMVIDGRIGLTEMILVMVVTMNTTLHILKKVVVIILPVYK